jgi:N utilization substance protein B
MASARRTRQSGEDVRSNARERALHILYEAEAKSIAAAAVLEAQILAVDEMTVAIVSGVAERAAAIDELISEHATGWTLARMPSIDRNVLRIGSYELLGRPDVPVAVIINEAVELAKTFSTDESGRFVNGVLSAIAAVVRPDEK